MTKIVVIDDCEAVRTTLHQILSADGFSVVAMPDDESGFAYCQGHPVDLIICDLVLPQKKGAEGKAGQESGLVGLNTISDLKRLCPLTPIVGMSGCLVGDALRTMQEAGAASVLAKPFNKESLDKAISRALKSTCCGTA